MQAIFNKVFQKIILPLFAFQTLSANSSINIDNTAIIEWPIETIPKYEMRAVWLTTIGGLDWPHVYSDGTELAILRQKQELSELLDKLKYAGINTILFQTRIRATTIYPSSFEPWDGCATGIPGKSPGYDILEYAINECHRRGLQLHAWIVTIPVGKWNSFGCTQLRKKYPNILKRIGQEGYLNPESSQTAIYLSDICEEIVRNYDVDGIHLDYIRYPETWKMTIPRHKCRKYITSIAESISTRLKAIKPWVMMSCSPIGKYDDLKRYSSKGWNARTIACQDAQEWLKSGLMDALFPMLYFRDNNFYPFAFDWKEQSNGKIICPGIATYMLDRREGNWPLQTISQEISVLRQMGMGHSHFRTKFLTDNTKGIYRFESQFNSSPALIPPMSWVQESLPESPTDFNVSKKSQNIMELSWNCKSDDLLFNVYSSYSWPVDISDARNIIATRLMEKHLTIKMNQNRFFAITAIDRFGNESLPVQSHKYRKNNTIRNNNSNSNTLTKGNHSYLPLFYCNGEKLQLSKDVLINKDDKILIETLQGIKKAYMQCADGCLDLKMLPDGIYQIKSINRKGISHRIGVLMIER